MRIFNADLMKPVLKLKIIFNIRYNDLLIQVPVMKQ